MNIAQILATKGGQVYTVRPEQTVRQALKLLAEHNVGALVVVDVAVKPIGILSERDIVRRLARDESALGMEVGALMTTPVVTGMPNDDLTAAGATMTERRFRHLPVLDGGRLIGVVSLGDIVKAQRDEYLGEIETLETQLIQEGEGKAIKH